MVFKNGKNLINGKELKECNIQERMFMHSFFREAKMNSVKMENFLLNENQGV